MRMGKTSMSVDPTRRPKALVVSQGRMSPAFFSGGQSKTLVVFHGRSPAKGPVFSAGVVFQGRSPAQGPAFSAAVIFQVRTPAAVRRRSRELGGIRPGCSYRGRAAGRSPRTSLPGSRRRPFAPDALTGVPRSWRDVVGGT
jgi:hypothetical protein